MKRIVATVALAVVVGGCEAAPPRSARSDSTWKRLPDGSWQEVPEVKPAPAPAPSSPKAEIGRYRIYTHPKFPGAFPDVLLDTVTGETWSRCTMPNAPDTWGMWCAMEQTTFAVPVKTAKK